MSKHFIRLDTNNIIIKGFSDAFEQPIETDICINEDGERHFELNGIVNPSLIDIQGRYNYKFEDNKVIALTEEEKKNLFPTPSPQPTAEETLAKELANIKIDNMKKDVMMTNALQTIASLKIQVMNLKGGTV